MLKWKKKKLSRSLYLRSLPFCVKAYNPGDKKYWKKKSIGSRIPESFKNVECGTRNTDNPMMPLDSLSWASRIPHDEEKGMGRDRSEILRISNQAPVGFPGVNGMWAERAWGRWGQKGKLGIGIHASMVPWQALGLLEDGKGAPCEWTPGLPISL